MNKFKLSANTLTYIDLFISKLSPNFDLSPQEKSKFDEELKANLISSIEEIMDQGNPEIQALNIALVRFGDEYSVEEELRNSDARTEKTQVHDEKLQITEQKLKRADEEYSMIKRVMGVTVGFIFAMAGVISYVPHSTYAIFPIIGVLTGYIYAILAIVNKYKKDSIESYITKELEK